MEGGGGRNIVPYDVGLHVLVEGKKCSGGFFLKPIVALYL